MALPGAVTGLCSHFSLTTLENVSTAQSSRTDPETLFLLLLLPGPHRTSSLPSDVTEPASSRPTQLLLPLSVSHHSVTAPSPSQSLGSPQKGKGSPSPSLHNRPSRLPRCRRGKWTWRLPWPSHCQVERPKRTWQAERLTRLRGTRTKGVGVLAEKPCPLAHSLGPGFGSPPGPCRTAPDPTGPFLTTLGGDASGPPAETSQE